MTARILHISFVKLINTMEQDAREFDRVNTEIRRLEGIGEANLNANDRMRLKELRMRVGYASQALVPVLVLIHLF